MLIARSTCSDPGAVRSNSVLRSPGDQVREPQRKQIRIGLVKPKTSVANLPNMVKPVTSAQATSVCMRETVRGEWEQRAHKDRHRNLGDPFRWVKTQLFSRMHKAIEARSEVGRVHSSDEAGNDRRAKGRGHGSAANKTGSSA